MLITCALLTSFSAISACWIERAVWSQPPPGAAGAMILSSIWARAEVANRLAPAISNARQIFRTGNDMSNLLKRPPVLRAGFAATSSGVHATEPCDFGLEHDTVCQERALKNP